MNIHTHEPPTKVIGLFSYVGVIEKGPYSYFIVLIEDNNVKTSEDELHDY